MTCPYCQAKAIDTKRWNVKDELMYYCKCKQAFFSESSAKVIRESMKQKPKGKKK